MPYVRRGFLCVCALVLAGCGLGGGDEASERGPRITRAELALMVLPQEELGGLARGLRADDDSGPTSNRDAAEDTVDPDDTAGSLKGAGRLVGHKLYYTSSGLAALEKGKGVHLMGTEIELMREPFFAAQYLNKLIDDLQRLEGTVADGVRYGRVSTFDAVGVGTEAHGLTVASSFAGLRMHMTLVGFRRERVVAVAAIARGDTRDVQEEARELAAALDEHIQGVLAGEAEEKPARLAEPAHERAPFAGREKLPLLTLAGEDVPGEARAVDEGRRKAEGYVAYARTFEDVRLGGSHLRALRAETQLHPTPAAAKLAHRFVATPAGRKVFARALVGGIADEAVIDPWNVDVRALPDAGRGFSGVVVTFELPEGRLEAAAIFMRSGRVIEAVTGICRDEDFDPADLRPLAERARIRLGDAV